MKSTLLAAIVLTALAASAQAQQNPAWVELEDQVSVGAFGQTVDRVEDMNVVNAAGEKIGEIEEILGPDANTASALVVDSTITPAMATRTI